MPRALLVGIGGGTGSGKSALVRAIAERSSQTCIVDLDSYYFDRSHLDPEERAHLNYDEPAAFDLPLLLDHLGRLASGQAVRKPCYSFTSHTRIGTTPLAAAPLILVEGLFVLWWEALRAMLDLRLFVDVPPDIRLLRRLTRDVTERGRTVQSITAQYVNTVRPMHERYVEPTKAHADRIVDNIASGPHALQEAANALLQVLHSARARC